MDSKKDQLIANPLPKTDNVTQTSDKLTIIVKDGKKFCQYPLEDDWYLTRIRKIPCLGKKHNIIKFYAVANANIPTIILFVFPLIIVKNATGS